MSNYFQSVKSYFSSSGRLLYDIVKFYLEEFSKFFENKKLNINDAKCKRC